MADYNEKYSFRDFTGHSFKDAKDLVPGTVIRGSCFYQEGSPGKHIFPDDMTGVIFERCNLDNVFIPAGNTLRSQAGIDCTNKKIGIQADGIMWILEESGTPVKPLSKKFFQLKGWSTDPTKIEDHKTGLK